MTGQQPIRFGTDGIRGRAGELLTPNLALSLGYWVGEVLRQTTDTPHRPFIIGQDSRNSSDMLATALAAGLTAAGFEVWNVGLCPTPCIAYLTATTEAIGGAMISASHNPPADNGIKIFGSDGSKLSSDLQKQIEAHLNAGLSLPSTQQWGHLRHRPELLQRYRHAVQAPLQDRQPLRGLRVVLDLAWGSAVAVAPTVFHALGAEVIALHDRADGDRINVNCGSTHLDPLQQAVRETRAAMGFAFDGDADRVLAVDSQGRVVDGDHILYFWGQKLQSQAQLPKDMIVATVMSNLGFERAWQARGGQLVRAAVGDQYVHAEMLRHGAMLGGEQSGHILCRHYGVGGDGLLTAVHLATLVQDSRLSLAQLRDQSFTAYPQILRNVRVEDRKRRLHWQECEPLQQMITKAQLDMGDRGRVLVRASGTEPVIRVMVEAEQQNVADYWTETLVQMVTVHLAA
ncbi:phosphoglucosamine mutase [Thermosynechococcus sp. HN-54]|uniref:phosphoglucosamine mutase n=1 Tax=Thermosynechococcus sp. HN-54 TaxID=2933959 RepID=UPI00202D03DC|nr:phosphoglucosamine mutase [Thermosynechococcus sp. HN-54]URR36429.1 phosphoglucosamine mutase [Thermosynechococcus sp. HN-54]